MVEWKKLGEVCSEVIVPMRDRPKVFDGSIPWCRIEDIEGMYFNKSLSGLMVSESVINSMNLKVYPTGTVICSCSATLGVCAINTQPIITNQTFIGLVCSERINNRFLYYYMSTRKKELFSLSTTGTIPYVSREKFEKMVVPIPSLSEQKRIVEQLDTFTSTIDNLKEQIAQRRKQYEYYRDQLLDLEGKPGVEMKTLGEVANVLRGKRLTKNMLDDDAPYPVFHGGIEPLGFYNQYNREANTVMVINVGASAGTVGYCDRLFWSSDGCFCISHSDLLQSKYLYYYLETKTHYLQSQVRHAGIPTLDNPVVERVSIPLLPIPEQQRIVSILDTFEASIQNLEAQLNERQKQYEYYRNKLLSFE